MEIKDVFGAQPKSVWEFLCENGQGFYVPAYQRQYSWDDSKIFRLFEDSCHGFSLLVDRDDAITFIGTIISIHDTQLLTVSPLVKGDVPAKVMTIIDGQQRLTTLLLTNTVLHDEIRLRLNKIANSELEEDIWVVEECRKTIGRLAKTFEEDKDYGDDQFRYYPRMIRSYEDSWSRKKNKAKYTSPIGRYLHHYGIHARTKQKGLFKYLAPNDGQNISNHKFLADSRSHISRIIKLIAGNKNNNLEFPSFKSIVNSNEIQETLLKAEIPQEVRNVLVGDDREDLKSLVRIILFSNFVLDRIAITIVTAKNEDYAFDMFESLNTTGEPLTAFETFKPRVIASEGLEEYETSKSHTYIKSIEQYLEGFGKSNEKQDATSKLIVSFALAEKGEKKSKRLSDQRRFLRDSFEAFKPGDERQAFVQHFMHSSLFVQYAWPLKKQDSPVVHSFPAVSDLTLLCLDFLRQSNHSITLGPLIRFYSELRQSPVGNEHILSFDAAVKSITAFSVLWRSSRRGTQNIDALYRDLMKDGCEGAQMRPLCRISKDLELHGSPNHESLKRSLVLLLSEEGGITSKEDWVKLASRMPSYTNNIHIARFLLLASAHDSVADEKNPGMHRVGKKGTLDLLNLSKWKDDQSQTVEHIAPKGGNGVWGAEIYEDQEVIHRLGNLTLLPRIENASIGNRCWEEKRLIYRVLSAPTIDELDPLLAEAALQDIDLSKSTTDLLMTSPFLPMVEALKNVDTDWSVDLIEKRSVRIAELAWDRIAPWLGL